MTRKVLGLVIATTVVLCAISAAPAAKPTVTKVACIGDSITFGHGIKDRNKNSFPAQVGALLGKEYEVKNFGVSGSTLLKKGNKPYWKLNQFKAAQAYRPDIVIIKLGTNDTKPNNWKHKAEFKPNYVEMVKVFQGLESKPAVWVCYPIPVYPERWGINDKTVKGEIIPLIDEVARETGAQVIDLYKPMADKAELVPDKVHPNAAGATVIAETIVAAISKQAPQKSNIALALGAPFADNAVLQRQMKVPVWGWASPGMKVTVEFAGQKKTASAGKDGKWMLRLDPLTASATPAEMVVSENAGKSITLKNILVGEVWMASGQSNMQSTVLKSTSNKLHVEAKGKVAPIREFEVTSVYSALHPIEQATGSWKNGDYTKYSAIAFAFAHKLHENLNVPIGILNCSFSMTSIQAWVPRVGFRDGKDEYTRAIYQKILETDPTTPEHKAAWDKFYTGLEGAIKANDDRIKNGLAPAAIATKPPGNLGGNRDASWMFNGRLNPVIPYAIRGAIWNQGYANTNEGLVYYNNLHSLVRGWRLRWNCADLPVYFHQFYCPGQKGGWTNNDPVIGGAAEMRLGTWLARDIPNTGMASQIDITGGIHYHHKAVPGQRLALHALKNQYGKKIVADGPMYKSYTVKGNRLIVEFDSADGGLVVAEAGTNATGKGEGATGFADPTIVANGDDQVKLFYLAGADRIWHPASMKIEGDKVIVTSPKVKKPRGVSYATGGVAFQPALYNKALLPATPFIYYDSEMVLSKTWPDGKLQVAGKVIDPDSVGLKYEWRKMPILSTQFRDNAVFQAGVPVTIWGSTRRYGEWETGPGVDKAVLHFSFGGIKKTIAVTPDMHEWQVVLPPMAASAEPKTLKVSYTIDGEVAHERTITNIVIGDVWYVAAPSMKLTIPAVKPSGGVVRMMARKAKRSSNRSPSRFSIAVSRTPGPGNRFAAQWTNASGLAGALGQSIAAKTGKPVGVVFMQNSVPKGGDNPEMKEWIAPAFLNQAPSLMSDYKTVGSLYPGNPYYNANIRNYVGAWKKYWSEYIPEMMATARVPDGVPWGSILSVAGASGSSRATQTYNVMVYSFTPASFKGIVFLCSEKMVEANQGANYGPELSVLANCWKTGFGGEDPYFFYTIPSKALAPKVARPAGIKGKSTAFQIDQWSGSGLVSGLIDTVMKEAYK